MAHAQSAADAFRSDLSTRVAWLLIAGGLALVIGAFLPWVTISAPFIGTLSKSGIDGGDGWITLALGATLAVFGFRVLKDQGTLPFAAGLVVAGIAGAMTLFEMTDVSNRISDVRDAADGMTSAHIGVGLWLSAAGVVAAVVAVLQSRGMTGGNQR
jgi:hypothetical protein